MKSLSASYSISESIIASASSLGLLTVLQSLIVVRVEAAASPRAAVAQRIIG